MFIIIERYNPIDATTPPAYSSRHASQLLRRCHQLIPSLPQPQPARMRRAHPLPQRAIIGEVGAWSQLPAFMVSVPHPRCTSRCDDQRLKLFDKIFIYSVDDATLVA